MIQMQPIEGFFVLMAQTLSLVEVSSPSLFNFTFRRIFKKRVVFFSSVFGVSDDGERQSGHKLWIKSLEIKSLWPRPWIKNHVPILSMQREHDVSFEKFTMKDCNGMNKNNNAVSKQEMYFQPLSRCEMA